MNTLAIECLAPEHAELVRELRLELLHAHPEYFSADPDYESSLTLEQWRERLNSPARRWLVCRVDGMVAGLCVFSAVVHTRKQAHQGEIGSMYVREAFRGKGVADALLKTVFDIAQDSVEQISLAVNADNARAIAFYERHGFRSYGRKPRAILVDGKYFDELEMMRSLSTSD